MAIEEEYSEISPADLSRLNEGPRETDPFDGGVTMQLAGSDPVSKAAFYSLEDSDIRILQKAVDKKAIAYIDWAEKQEMITPEGAEYLRSYYTDSMQSYADFYDTMTQVLGRPSQCLRNDLAPEEQDDTNYSETYITPNNSMLLVYPPITDDPDLADNHMLFTLPGMKNVVRAVAKIAKGGKYDVAIIEELVHFSDIFNNYSHQGIPDVRVIVYKGYPAMAMMRLATAESDGRANLHQGAVGVGLDIRSGKAINAVMHNIPITHHPDTGVDLMKLEVPLWKEHLEIATKAYDMTNLGYLGADIVLDKFRGPMMLELNARPGLAIQIANRKGLAKVLENIDKNYPQGLNAAERLDFVLKNN